MVYGTYLCSLFVFLGVVLIVLQLETCHPHLLVEVQQHLGGREGGREGWRFLQVVHEISNRQVVSDNYMC